MKLSIYIVNLLLIIFFILGCQKDKMECIGYDNIPYPPYHDPIWQPDGQLIGFNYSPMETVYADGTSPCVSYSNSLKRDSAGFYLINKDGSGLKRITTFYLNAPAWSPDGKWIAFYSGSNLYKIPFVGNTLDTNNIIQLTTANNNFFPCWTANSDTIYFDSDKDTPPNTDFFSIWKMPSDGNMQIRLTQSAGIGDTRMPYVGTDNRVYFMNYVAGQPEVFSMKKDGTDFHQITFNGKTYVRRTPKYYQGKAFYWDRGIYSTPITSYNPRKIAEGIEEYNISGNGEIVYVNTEYVLPDKRYGTLWIMNSDGTHKRQLTFNYY